MRSPTSHHISSSESALTPQRPPPASRHSAFHQSKRIHRGHRREQLAPGASMGSELVERRFENQGSRLEMHCHGGLEHRVAGGSQDLFDQCCLSRFAARPFRPGGLQCTGRRPAQNTEGPGEEASSGPYRPAVDQTSESGLVLAYAQERQTGSEPVCVCGLSDSQKPQGRQTQTTEVALWRLESEGVSPGNPADAPASVRDRIQLPPVASGQDLHLHARTTPASAVRGGRTALAECVGLDPQHIPFRRDQRGP